MSLEFGSSNIGSMFPAYDFESKKSGHHGEKMIRTGIDGVRKEARRDNHVSSSKRYVAGKAPNWAAFDHSDDDDLATRYQAATSNEVRQRSKVRPKYEMPTGKIVPRNQRYIRVAQVVDREDRDRDRDRDHDRERDREDRSRDREDRDRRDRHRDRDDRDRPSTARSKPETIDYHNRSLNEEPARPSVRRSAEVHDHKHEANPDSRRSRREVAKPQVYHEPEPRRSKSERRRRRSSSSSSRSNSPSPRKPERSSTSSSRRRPATPVQVADDHLARLANYDPSQSSQIKADASSRRRHASSSSDDDNERIRSSAFGASEGRLEPDELDANAMISRRARLLAGRQAKKEYEELKEEMMLPKKKVSTKDGGYYDSDDEKSEEAPIESEEEEESSEEESEIESSESDDIVPKMKPIFTRKKDRLTLEDEEDLAQRESEMQERKEQEAQDRRSWTLNLVDKEKAREKADMDYKKTKISIKSIAKALADLNTDDSDEEAAFSHWKSREFQRLKREKAEHEEELKKEEDRARRAEMDDSELEAEAYQRKTEKTAEKRTTQKFLQRYFHKGVFFQDDEELVEKLKVRAAAPTMDDKFDRSVLPEIMQTKYFGKRSQQKHTHLSKEDTSRKDAWGRGSEDPRAKVFTQPKQPR